MIPLTPTSTLFPYTTLFRSHHTRTRRCHPSRSQRENTATQCARGGMLHRGPRMTSSGRTIVAWLLGFSSATAAAFATHDGATERPSMPTAQQATFNRDIAPILFRYCAPCHRPGEAGPFPLLTYPDAKARARQI